MEDYGNTSWMELTREQDDYFEENHEEFYTDVCKALEEIGESGHDLHSIGTTMGRTIMDDLQEY